MRCGKEFQSIKRDFSCADVGDCAILRLIYYRCPSAQLRSQYQQTSLAKIPKERQHCGRVYFEA
jgi:hypothetical protein